MTFEAAAQVAEAVLYEGYVLYPYRASAGKNKLRWQFGVIAPRDFAETDPSEDWAMQTECPMEFGKSTCLDVKVRCLRVQQRQLERIVDSGAYEPVDMLDVDGTLLTAWDEAVEEEIDVPGLWLADLFEAERVVDVELPSFLQMESTDGGRITRRRHPLSVRVRVAAVREDTPWPLARISVRIENVTDWSAVAPERDAVMRRSLAAVHTLMAVTNGAFISMFDAPEFAKASAAECVNLHTWPVLIGDSGQRDVVLSSPVTLYDYPSVAPESIGDFYDSTEIDEMLALRVMTLTDEEKREARGTDARAAAIIDRCDVIPDEVFERLHGTVRYLRDVTSSSGPEPEPGGAAEDDQPKPWWDPGVDASVNPFEDQVWIGPVQVGRGTKVRLRPSRRADAYDMFLIGRDATVEGVFQDVDGNTQVAVSVLDDPMAELAQWHGRFLYFYPDEVEPLEVDA
ncbi:MAG: hypothetical protein ACRD12_19725 [Acidimicrobiales bacterium]